MRPAARLSPGGRAPRRRSDRKAPVGRAAETHALFHQSAIHEHPAALDPVPRSAPQQLEGCRAIHLQADGLQHIQSTGMQKVELLLGHTSGDSETDASHVPRRIMARLWRV